VGIDPLLHAHQEFVRYAAAMSQACPILGITLTPETTVVIDLSDGVQQVLVMSGDAYDRHFRHQIPRYQFEGVRVEIFDGRLLFAESSEDGWQVYPPD